MLAGASYPLSVATIRTGVSCAGACHDEHRPLGVEHRLPLSGVQVGEIGLCFGDGQRPADAS